MAIDTGTDIAAVDDLPDPETLVSGQQNIAYAMVRRWLTPTGGMADTGETEPYPSIDLKLWLGGNIDLSDNSILADLEQQAEQVQKGVDPRVTSCTVTGSFSGGLLALTAQAFGPSGPFPTFVFNLSQQANGQVFTQLLFPGQS